MNKLKQILVVTLILVFNTQVHAYLMCSSSGSSSATGVLYDSGGPTGNYGNNENCAFQINPPCNRAITIIFNSFNTENLLDVLRIYDGTSTAGTLILAASGTAIPSPVTAYSGSVFIVFTTDISVTRTGFEMVWTTSLVTSAPSASFTISDTFPPLLGNVRFTDNSAGYVSSRNWEFGDQTGSALPYPVHAYGKSGFYNVKLKVGNCLGQDSITKSLTVQDTPVINPNLSSISMNLSSCNDSAQRYFRIFNSGNGSLFYDLHGENFLIPVELLALTYGVDYNNEYQHTLAALQLYFKNFHLTEINTTSANILDSLLNGKDVLLIAKQETGSPLIFAGFSNVMKKFIARGGTVIFCGTTSAMSPLIFSTGLFNGGYAANVGSSRIAKTTVIHPYTIGVDTAFNAPVNTFAVVINDADAIRLFKFSSTYDVVTTRDTGNGHIVYIAFDYSTYDTNAAKIIANVVRNSNYKKIPGWFSFTKTKDTISIHDSDLILLKFRAGGFGIGYHHGEIKVVSNDPVNPLITVSVSMLLAGRAEIVINDSVISYDSVLRNFPKTDTVLVQNTGCDTLRIYTIKSGTVIFQPHLLTLKIPPYQSGYIPVMFDPPAAGFFLDTLQLKSNAGNVRILLSGYGVNPPVIEFGPDTLKHTLTCNDSTTRSFYIYNKGLSDLYFNIFSDNYSPPVKMLALTYGVDYFQEYLNTLSAIKRYFTNYSIKEINTTSKKTLDSFLQGMEVLLIADQETSNPAIFADFDSVLNAFLLRGGIVIFCGSDINHMDCMFNTNIFSGYYIGSLNSSAYIFSVAAPNNPVCRNLPSVIYSSNAVYYSFITNPDKLKLVDLSNTWDVAAYRKIGKGQAVYIGYDYYSYDSNAARLVSNAVQLASRKALPGWLSLSQYTDTIKPGDSVLINAKINTTGMFAGSYKAYIVINSNDPVDPVDTLPFMLNVNCRPVADFNSDDVVVNIGDSIHFRDLSLNYPTSWKWYFPYSSTPFSTLQNPVIAYPLNGYYDITLVVENALGKDSITKRAYIQVVNNVKMCSTKRTSKASGILLDSGGTMHNYNDQESCTLVIEPTCANSVTLIFDSFNLELNYDYIYVYDGDSKAGKLLLTATGNTLPAAVTATSGKMFIDFESDQLLNFEGFHARWTSSMPVGFPTDAGFAVSDTNFPVKTNVSFTDTSTDNPFAWYWDFGDGDTSTAQHPSHIYRSPGSRQVMLVATNCFGTDTFIKKIFIQDWPAFSCSPTSFKIDNVCLDSITASLEIYNSGNGNMTWEIDTGNSKREIELLALTYGVNYTGEYQNTINAIRKHFTDFHLTEIKTPDASLLQQSLVGKDVLLIAEQVSGLPVFFATFSTVLNDYVNKGGTVIFCGSYDNYANCMFSTGLFHGSYYDYLYQNTDTLKVLNNKHPITSHLKDSIFGAAVITYLVTITDTDAVRLVHYKGKDVVTVRQQGKGKVVYTGFNYYEYPDNISRIIANAVTWGSTNKLPGWVQPDKFNGVTKDTALVRLTFHKKGLQSGVYRGNIAIYTNDSNHNKNFIPLEFDIANHFPAVKLGNDTFLCPGDSIATDAGGFYKTYSWNDSISANRFIWISVPGKYYVTVTDSNDCVSADTMLLFNYTLPELKIKDLKPVFCLDDNPVVLKGIPPGGIFSGTGVSAGTFFPQKADTGIHCIKYSLTDSNRCYSDTTRYITVVPLPFIYLGKDTVLNLTDSLILDAGDGFSSYNWNNGYSSSRFLNLKGKYFIPGDYIFMAEVGDTNGCFNSDTVFITFIDTTSGIDEFSENLDLKIYPNPSRGIIFLEFCNPGGIPLDVEIINSLQESIFSKSVKGGDFREKADLTGKARGIYLVRVKAGKRVFAGKILLF